MTNQIDAPNYSPGTKLAGALILLTLFGALIYFFLLPQNPPGFYIDESSIAYNAYLSDQDGRSRFPYDLELNDTAGVHLEITAPEVPGDYVLEFDVVQEQVAWFGDKGSRRFRRQVTVGPSTSTRGAQ